MSFFDDIYELSVYVGFYWVYLLVFLCILMPPSDLLISTVIPILKEKNFNTTDSANYSGISS